MLLAGYIDSKSNFAEAQSNIQLPRYADVDADGQVGPQDVLLVVRGIQLIAANRSAVAASSKLVGKDLWDNSLVEVLTKGLPKVSQELSKISWLIQPKISA